MNKAQIENGIVTNIILVDPQNIPDWCADWPEVASSASIGDVYVNGSFAPAPNNQPDPDEALAAERAAMVCSKLQGRVALFRAGKLEAVEGLVDALGGEIKLAWDNASELRRMSANIIALAKHPSVGMTDGDLDSLFRTAMTITF